MNNKNSFGTEIETRTENDFLKELQSSLQMLWLVRRNHV